ncbi:MAG: hypothetical protein V3W18_07955 [candidate division Zixibacteria bacterium]
MKKLLKSRLLIAVLLSTLLHIVGGLLVMAPFLIFLRLHLEHSGLAFKLWPVISPEVLGDILVNYPQALTVYIIAAVIIYIAWFPLKILFTAGIYNVIIVPNSDRKEEQYSISEYLKKAVSVWPGFAKIAVFGMVVYLTAIFIGFVFGGLLSKIGSLFGPLMIILFLLAGSTYLQILRIYMVVGETSSLRSSIRDTRIEIAGSLARVVLGNVSVIAAGFVAVLLPWILLKWVRSFDWNLFVGALSVILQQAIILLVCLAQVLRINFNVSVLRKGE